MLAIAGGKGGAGKTTTALGLAASLAHTGGDRTLVADADTEMPDVPVVADVPTEPGLAGIARGRAIPEVTHRSGLAGVDAVPPGGIDPQTLPGALDRLRTDRVTTLVDCPAGAARDAAIPLRYADRTLLVTTPTRQSLHDTAKTAAMADALDAPPIGVVLTRASGEPDAEPSDSTVRSLLDCQVLTRVPTSREPPLTAKSVRSAYDTVAKKINKRNI